MPVPLHIRQRPRRLRAWIKDRHATLAAAERLVGKGYSERQAAHALGLTHAGLLALRESLDALAGEGARLHGRTEAERLDLGLAMDPASNALRKPLGNASRHPVRLSADDLAAERAGGIRRAWKWVRRSCVPYHRPQAATLATLA